MLRWEGFAAHSRLSHCVHLCAGSPGLRLGHGGMAEESGRTTTVSLVPSFGAGNARLATSSNDINCLSPASVSSPSKVRSTVQDGERTKHIFLVKLVTLLL